MEEQWLSTEKLVHLIEKTLSPESSVQHNIRLPDLTSSTGKKRQCDIVITSGEKGRETITIIEVQKRKSKLDINTFGGFIHKMRDIGAQHLICVSSIGFPKSVTEKAKQYGGAVRLVTLNKHEPDNFPINLPRLNVHRMYCKFSYEEFPELDFKAPHSVNISLDDLVFEIVGLDNRFNYSELGEYYVSHILKPFESNSYKIKFPLDLLELNVIYQDEKFPVLSFKWDIDVTVEEYSNFPVYGYQYEQLGSGDLVWVLESFSVVEGKERLIRMPLKLENGKFVLANIQVSN